MLTPDDWRRHAEFLRTVAKMKRDEAGNSNPYWRQYFFRDADRLEADAEFALDMARRDEIRLQENATNDAA